MADNIPVLESGVSKEVVNMIWIWIISALMVLFLGSCFGFFLLACLRIDSLSADLQKTLDRPVYRDCKAEIMAGLEEMSRQPHETVTIRSYDGLQLKAEFYPQPNARGTILMFHGWRGSPESDFGCAMPAYYKKGLNLLLVHQRTQGSSEGRFITFGIRESRDVHSWVDWHGQRFGKEASILITGISMGATTVLMSAGQPYGANVRGLIADCGFTSPKEIISSVVGGKGLPSALIVPVMGFFARIFAGFGFREYSTLDAVKDLKLPVIFAHGKEDKFVPCHMTETAYECCGSEDKTLIIAEKAGHGASYLVDRDNYEKHITDFVNRCLR